MSGEEVNKKEWLDVDDFDVVLLGTGFTESVLSGALSRVGKSVLHLDPNQYYGGFDSSFTLNHLITSLGEYNTPVEQLSTPSDVTEITDRISINANSKQLPMFFTNVKIHSNENQYMERKEKERLEKEAAVTPATTTAEGESDTSAEEPKKQPPKEKTLEELGRSFSIDILPNVLYSKGSLVNLLITSSTSKYLEFKNLDQNYLYFNNRLNEIPSTKGSVFKDNTFSLFEKRTIMKFITTITDIYSEISKETEEETEEGTQKIVSFDLKKSKIFNELSTKFETFIQFIKSQKFSREVETLILHGITLQQESSLENLTLQQGIEAVNLYISSLLVYSPNPFLLPYYGCGDIPQAFVRLSAVFGGTFVLDRTIRQLGVDQASNKIATVQCSKHQTIKTKYFITTPKFLESSVKLTNSSKKVYARFIGITDKKIENTKEQSYIIVPPNTISSNKNVINLIQMDTICVPWGQDKTLYHITTLSDQSISAEAELKPVVENFFNVDLSSGVQEKPNLLWYTYFNVTLDEVDHNQTNQHLPDNLFVISDSAISSTIDYQTQINQAKQIFSKICPGQIFLEKVPDQEDIIYSYGGEESTTDDNTNTTDDNSNTTESTTTNTETKEQE